MANDVSLTSESSSLKSGSIKWSGLGSGTDFTEVVDQLVEIERTHINRLESWKAEWESKNESITALNTRMVSLKLNARDMDTYSEFYTMNSISSNESVVTTTNTSQAEKGTHTIQVGTNIQARTISASYNSASGIGGTDVDDLVITIGSSSLTLAAGVDFTSATTIMELASAINALDDAGDDILFADILTDKTRGGDVYKRLVITANQGGDAYQISVSDPTRLNFDETTVDAAYEKSWLGSTSTPESSGVYTGSTNKTFTFAMANSGELGTDAVTVNWADNEGNSGSIDLEVLDWDPAKEYEVFQGVTVKFGAGRLIQNEAFTIDVYAPTMQSGQDKGLAQAEKRVHQGFSDLISPIHSGPSDAEFIYFYEGRETTITIPDGTTLQGLIDKINSDPGNPGVTASVVDDGQGTATSYHLVLTGNDTGSEHTIRFGTTASPPSAFAVDEAAFSTTQRATDSMVKLDGFPLEDYNYIQRSSNTISDVIGGMVLELHGVGGATITVAADTGDIQDKVIQLVQSVNFVLDYIKEETKYVKEEVEGDTVIRKSGVMIGNYTYDIVRNAINEILFTSIPGLDGDSDTYTHLSQIGIATDPDLNGEWVVDEAKLAEALNNDMEAVAKLFVGDESLGVEGVAKRMLDKLTALTDDESGIANVLVDNYNGIIKSIDDKIALEERRIDLVRSRLEEKFYRLESLLSELDGQATYLDSQISQMSSSS